MNEREWRGCTDPQQMLESLRGKATDRKLRLFACACFRSTWPLLNDAWERMVNPRWWSRMRWSPIDVELAKREADLVWRGVELAERYADGLIDLAELEALFALPEYESVNRGCANEPTFGQDCFTGSDAVGVAKACAYRARYLAKYYSPSSYPFLARFRSPSQPDHDREQSSQCQRLRDLFGPLPFRPVAPSPSWLTPDVLALSHAAYEHRTLPSGTLEPTRLSVLADALEDAGCANADLLGHLRGAGPHVRGCWAVDLVLGRE
jgi:hypothetical protein